MSALGMHHPQSEEFLKNEVFRRGAFLNMGCSSNRVSVFQNGLFLKVIPSNGPNTPF